MLTWGEQRRQIRELDSLHWRIEQRRRFDEWEAKKERARDYAQDDTEDDQRASNGNGGSGDEHQQNTRMGR